MWYAVSQNGQEVEKVYYAYHAGGHADQIIRKAAGDETYYRTYFLYDKQGRTWMVVKDQWQLDGQTGEPVNAQRTWAREFRYAGSGRQRYLTRARDPQTLLPASAADGLWSDYDGEGVYGDYGVDVGTGTAEGTTLMQYEPGLWQRDAADPEMPLDYYFHGDIIGSTRAMSDGEGSAVQRVIYTAFGERVYASGGAGVPPSSRYGYAGTWGYEGGGVWGDENELPYLHVGERLYDPATGRFLQRDPIGVRGGLNTYLYLGNTPTRGIDPNGMDPLQNMINDVLADIAIAQQALSAATTAMAKQLILNQLAMLRHLLGLLQSVRSYPPNRFGGFGSPPTGRCIPMLILNSRFRPCSRILRTGIADGETGS